MVEQQNPTTPEGVNTIVLMPPLIKTLFPHCATTTLGITLARSMANHVKRSWNLTIDAWQYSGWTLDTSVQLALKTRWRIVTLVEKPHFSTSVRGTKMSFNLTTTFGVPPFSHNVVAKWNTTIGWIPKMANVSTKNNGVQHIVLATPNQTFRCFGPKNRTKRLPWHSTISWCPYGMGNGVCQHKWLWESHLELNLTTLKIQSFINTLWFWHPHTNSCHWCSCENHLTKIWNHNMVLSFANHAS
jgi:hypothetical protein